jgi:hypothetical protein
MRNKHCIPVYDSLVSCYLLSAGTKLASQSSSRDFEFEFLRSHFHSQSQRNPQFHYDEVDVPLRIQKGNITVLHVLWRKDPWQAFPYVTAYAKRHIYSFFVVPVTPKHDIVLNLNSKDIREPS